MAVVCYPHCCGVEFGEGIQLLEDLEKDAMVECMHFGYKRVEKVILKTLIDMSISNFIIALPKFLAMPKTSDKIIAKFKTLR